MSAATSEWPAWLRRRTAVELLGPPRVFFAWLTIALSLGAIVYVGAWNAAKYPVALGYDAQPNAVYMHVLLDYHRLPRPDESGEANQPPLYYLLAGVAARAGHTTFGWLEARGNGGFPESSYRGAQIFNVVLVFLTALCILWLARIVAPGRPWVGAASVAFFAFLPVVSKTEAMIHSENLNLFLSAIAITTTTALLAGRRPRLPLIACIALAILAGIGTRASIVFVILAVAAGTVFARRDALVRTPNRRRAVLVALALALAASAVVSYDKVQGHRVDANAKRSSLVLLSPRVFTAPWRPNFLNEAIPTTYADLWGDWFGSFSWSVYGTVPWPPTQRILKDQSLIGLIPTILAVLGLGSLLSLAVNRRRELAPLAFLPVIALIGYLARSWLALTADGDLLKATYMLNTAPAWAIAFGMASQRLLNLPRPVRIAAVGLLAAFAVLELRFMMYGIRDHRPIF